MMISDDLNGVAFPEIQSLILSFSQREKERGLNPLSRWERVGVRGGGLFH